MANTTWNSADKVSVTLSGTNNLTASTTALGSVRTILQQSSGKSYFEYTGSSIGGVVIYGVANAAVVLSTVTASQLGVATVNRSGTIFVNSVQFGSVGLIGALPGGSIAGVALDLTNNLIWFRVAPSGNWNGSGTANPATGVGGASITSIVPGLYGYFGANGTGISTTANFGDSAFSGAVPSGFTAGFPSVPAVLNGPIVTMIG